MDESSDDPVSMLKVPTPVRRAIPKPRRSNPLYVSHKEHEQQGKEESSEDPTLLKSSPRAPRSLSKVVLRGITPRKPRSTVTGEGKEKIWVALEDAIPVEENADVTLRPGTEHPKEDQQPGNVEVTQDEMTLDEENHESEIYEAGIVAEEFEMRDEEEVPKDDFDVDGDQEMQDLELSEGEFQPHTSDDEIAFRLKSTEEQEEIADEIQELLTRIPDLKNDYELVDRLGTGWSSNLSSFRNTERSSRYILLCIQGNRSQLR